MALDSEIFLPNAPATRETGRHWGHRLAEALAQKHLSLPWLITLSGDLGAGKTTLGQGLGLGFGVTEPGEIVSPTFTLANEYQGLYPLFHLDIYRLETINQFYEAGLDEYLERPGLTLVEWPEKMPADFWPDQRLELILTFQGQGRQLRARFHPSWPDWL
ncbi:MAG: tRNA (adenosine(37)-N6)-threonylcarbamoyltransferase complex ATPase subunit type 1 TsaE [Candidatus Adiutrix sp.]|jgi:tRNA threonylcarbamoyladenosine biosynthesis protein TsaE|nr:tRNA (adenosine(37)-N6)-threonylcarbamoyltransferase complex ATPase subunit type 1 TsaE [Candidatus Adiutrix sp.]